jgi:hypothetical protein
MSTVRVGLITFAALEFAIAALMIFAPHLFFTDIGPYGVQNDHYLRDLATYGIAFGVALTVAYWHVQWRTPILYCLALQSGLHALNHLLDIGAAHPYWLGPANFIALALSAAALLWLARESQRPLEAQR